MLRHLAALALGCVVSGCSLPVASPAPRTPGTTTNFVESVFEPSSPRSAIGFPVQDGFTSAERAGLEAGFLIPRPMRFTRAGTSYVGGVSYQLVQADAEAVLASLEPSRSLAEVLPMTKDVSELRREASSRVLRVTHGKGPITVAYTVDVRREPDAFRFWLDAAEPNDIRDVWGYLRVSPYDDSRSLITVGVALDLGPGVVRALFEDRVRDGMLATAARIARYVEQGQGGAVASGGARSEPLALER